MNKNVKIYFFSLLLAVSFFAANAQVTINNKVARYFLEVEDRYQVLLVKDSLQTGLITVLRLEVNNREEKIATYKADSTTYQNIQATLQQKISLKEKQNHNLRKEIWNQKLQKWLSWLITVGTIVIAAL